MYDVESTIGSQYANSPVLTALIDSMVQWIDPTVNLQQFYSYLWNIYTAQGFGLDTWGVIIGVSRVLQVNFPVTYFGFNGGLGVPFNNGAPFYNGGANIQAYALSDADYLPLLLTKALANISETTIPALNTLLQNLFSSYGVAYVQDHGGMVMSYVFNFSLTPVQYAIVATSGVLPHPTGVLVDISTPSDNGLLAETGDQLLTEQGLDILLG
jgi:Protein of unknown function (DUF2612)